jgi:tRNA(Ile2) C34 agmatinyltransferase TiaS
MPKMQPSPPICPNCHKTMKLMLVKETGRRELRCIDCEQSDPPRWLNGELGSEE